MTHDPAPLSLPASDWEGWLAARCDGQLDEARRAHGRADRGHAATPAATLALWNDLNLALHNAFASASSLLANVHPDEAVRTRAEQAEQDAPAAAPRSASTASLYDVLSAVDPRRPRRGRPPGARAGAARLPPRRRRPGRATSAARLRELAERETAVGQEFAKNIRDGVRSIRVDARRARRAAGRLRGEPPGRRRRPGRDHHRLPRLRAVRRPSAGTATPARRSCSEFLEPRLARERRRCCTSCSSCAASTPGCSATTAGRPTTPRSR